MTGTRAVVRAITVLKALGRSTSAYGVTELGTATGLSKATVFRLLGALENEGMVARDASTGTYRLGPELISLGASALSTTDLRAITHDELVRLTDESGETTTLEILHHREVVVLDEVQGHFLFSAAPEIGRSWPAHATSTGKVLLAMTSPSPALRRLAKFASRTITSKAALGRELARVRQHEYAIAIDELEPGLVAMAAPIRNHLGYVIAALSLNGP
ncbi:MAG TPA: IclR family transcriptional regulator, partial [Gemmatimonadaceae bacterium]|nr:IclR family transcriptional regulator [Gemmatimonadaceae bacterium]